VASCSAFERIESHHRPSGAGKRLLKTCSIGFALITLVTLCAAQIPTSGNGFFGYSYSRGQAFSGINMGRVNMNGWEGSLEGKFLPWIGVVADLDWHYGSRNLPGCQASGCTPTVSNFNASRHTFLVGPRASISVGKYTPFAELLVGVAHQTDTGGNASISDTSFSNAVGGGLDYKLQKAVAWRVQLDSVYTRLFSRAQHDLRFSTGIVFRF
jgi:hypothetical protein